MSRHFLFVISLLFCIQVGNAFNTINLVVPGRKEDCLYLSKVKDELLEFSFFSDNAIDFRMSELNSANNIGVHNTSILRYTHQPTPVIESGDFAFCFHNRYSRQKNLVSFEYKNNNEALRHSDRELKEKANFQEKLLKIFQEKYPETTDYSRLIPRIARLAKNMNGMAAGNTTDAKIESYLFYISVCMDYIEQAVYAHKMNVRHHIHLQERNNEKVQFFSFAITVSMILAACAQLIAVKGFINGTFSWKVWSYK